MLYEEILTRILCKKWVYSKNKYKTVLSKELLLLVYANKKKMLFSDKSTQKLNIIVYIIIVPVLVFPVLEVSVSYVLLSERMEHNCHQSLICFLLCHHVCISKILLYST
jgi:hypothetical protein